MDDAHETIVVRFRLPDGELLERIWTWADIKGGSSPSETLGAGVPSWLEHASRAWPHPKGPIIFTGHVKPGHEAAAREYVERLP